MRKKTKAPSMPAEKRDTVRREIFSVLAEGTRAAKEISFEVGISEKDVYGHLDHIRRSIDKTGRRLVVTPAKCRRCGFVFRKRDRLKKPGKCPVCRGETISEPLFAVEDAAG